MPRFEVEIRERNGDPSSHSMTAETPENALYYVWEKLAGTGCEITGRVEPADETDPNDELPYSPDVGLTPRGYLVATWLTGFLLAAMVG
jgi:hypothetical protein